MPFRLFVPLPGPFAWTSRSRAERHYDRERRAAAKASRTPADRRVRLLTLLGGAFGIPALALFQHGQIGWGIAVVLVGMWALSRGIVAHLEMRADEADAEDEAIAAELRRRGFAGRDPT